MQTEQQQRGPVHEVFAASYYDLVLGYCCLQLGGAGCHGAARANYACPTFPGAGCVTHASGDVCGHSSNGFAQRATHAPSVGFHRDQAFATG